MNGVAEWRSLPPALASNRPGCMIGVLRRLIGVGTRLRLPSSWLALHLARNIGEDHLMTRRLALAARVSSVVLLGGIVLASIALLFWSTFEERAGEVEERAGEVALR